MKGRRRLKVRVAEAMMRKRLAGTVDYEIKTKWREERSSTIA
jgi:hypothetical protein